MFSGSTVAVSVVVSPSLSVSVLLLRRTSVIVILVSFLLTVIVQLAVFPFSLIAVIMAVPALFAVTLPIRSTVATATLLLLHLTLFPYVVFSGSTVAVRVVVSPSVSVALLLLRLISVIGISFLLTVTVQPAVFPFVLVAVITAVPALFAVTVPLASTVATASLLLPQLTFLLSVVFSGSTVAVSLYVLPSTIPTVLSLRRTSVTGICFFSTFTVQPALFPFVLVAVITAVPALLAVTFPLASTVATASLLLLQLTFLLSVVFSGSTVAVSLYVLPSTIPTVLSLRRTSVTGICFFSTFTVQPALFPFVLVAVITAVPALLAVTVPLTSTIATASLLLLHVMLLFSAFSGVTVAANVSLSPSVNVISDLLRLTLSTSTTGVCVSLSVNALIIKLHDRALPKSSQYPYGLATKL